MGKRGWPKNSAHVVMGDNSFRCLHCGTEQALALPMSINGFGALGKAFTQDHRRCKLSEAGRARLAYTNEDEWHESWDTGSSSLTIYHVLKPALWEGEGFYRGSALQDPADFGRCHRLLKVAPPSWRKSLQRVADQFPAWRPLVARWADLERLYEEELPSGEAPKLYELMRQLREETPA